MAKKRKKRLRRPVTVKSFLIPRLRRLSRWWPAKNVARNNAKIMTMSGVHKNGRPRTKVMYECNICGVLVDRDGGNIDHIRPVVSLDGFISWDDYINTLFCDASNLQHICKSCHDHKTELEQKERFRRRTLKTIRKKQNAMD